MKKNKDLHTRIVLGVFSVIIISMGISAILTGTINYSNFWGGVVFAPIAIIIGTLILIIVTFRWNSTVDSDNKPKKKK